jgi:mRNA interferase RelE/StbE
LNYKIIIPPNAEKQIHKLNKEIQHRIIIYLQKLVSEPMRYLIKLHDLPYYKARIGDYRVIINMNNDEMILLVIKVDHRKKVYQNLK